MKILSNSRGLRRAHLAIQQGFLPAGGLCIPDGALKAVKLQARGGAPRQDDVGVLVLGIARDRNRIL